MAITNARMQMRRGLEADFDPDKMQPGEWAVSLDKKYVRMCFSPGVCVRMATYEAFEEDMEQIISILEEAKTVQEAIEKIYEEFQKAELDIEAAENSATLSESYAHGGTGTRDGEDTDNAKYYAELAKKNIEPAMNAVSDIAINRQTLGYTKKNLQYNSDTYDGWLKTNTGGAILGETYNGGKIVKYTASWNYLHPPSSPFKAGTYTISFDAKVATSGNGHVYSNFGVSKTIWMNASDTFERYSVTFTLTEDKVGWIAPLIPSGSTVGELYIANVQTELGDTASEYEPYVDDVDTRLKATVPIERGGTGATTAKEAQYNLLKDMNEVTETLGDETRVMFHYGSPSPSSGSAYYRKAIHVWNYIKSKAEAIFAKKEDVALNRQTLGYTKKNLFNINGDVNKNYLGGVTTYNTVSDGVLTAKANRGSVSGGGQIIKTQIGKKYILSAKLVSLGTGDAAFLGLTPLGTNHASLTYFTSELVGKVCSIVYTATSEQTLAEFATRNGNNAQFTDIQVEMVDDNVITPTDYEPYVDDVDTRLNIAKSENTITKQTLGYTKKNLLKLKDTNYSYGETTINSFASSGTAIVNNSAAVTGLRYSSVSDMFYLKEGTYIFTGCPSGGRDNGYRQTLGVTYADDGTYYGDLNDYGDGVTLTVTKEMAERGMIASCTVFIFEGCEADNLTFYPMLRSADIEDGTFEPYVDDVDTRLKALTPVNNLLATVEGSPLDAVQGKLLADRILALETAIQELQQ